jgi:glycosyltransferase involved in cell wall biosynthesis
MNGRLNRSDAEPQGFAPERISVVIPHLNQPDFLDRCLASLASGTRPPDEVIVVDNGSHSLPQAICAAHGVRLLTEAEPGPGPARNLGVAAASGNILAFIDADCLADPGWLAAAEAVMADPSATILGGDVRIALTDPTRVTLTEAYESVYAYRMDRYIAREGFTGTGNLVVRRAVLEDVGPFAGIGVAEDRDWGHRATARGYRIRFVPQMQAYHPARQSIAELCTKWDRQSAHDYVRARARLGGRLRFALKTLAIVPSPLVELPTLLTTDRLNGSRARVLAFACLVRIRLHRAKVMARLLVTGDPERLSGGWNRG